MSYSHLANTLQGSEILKLSDEIRAKKAQGEEVHNLTVGDFDPKLFPLPEELTAAIQQAYTDHATNYPPAAGLLELRQAVSAHLMAQQGLAYDAESILISSGARPLIFGAFMALVDSDEKVIYPAPSWNNNHYIHLVSGEKVPIFTTVENGFLPTADELRPHVQGASLITLCSPLNPTGTAFAPEQLADICDLILEENNRRAPGAKPLYLIYDQIYNALTYGDTQHVDPVTLRPEMRPFTVFIDGMTKAFAATGVRVGWAFGPEGVIKKMRAILSHVGAWAARPEQTGTTHFLRNRLAVDGYLTQIRTELSDRLNGFYEGIQLLKAEGLPVDAVQPQGALYLSVKMDLLGKHTPDGTLMPTAREVYSYVLEHAGFAIVPFYAFGLDDQSPWFRLSVGTVTHEEIPAILAALKKALLPFSEKINA